MCAMVALVAPRELRISRLRVTRFLDSYIGVLDRFSGLTEIHKAAIELLMRLRLHSCAAYLRKYCQKEDIRRITLVCRAPKSWISRFILKKNSNSHSWVPQYILHVETVVNHCCYQSVPPTLVGLIEGDIRIA